MFATRRSTSLGVNVGAALVCLCCASRAIGGERDATYTSDFPRRRARQPVVSVTFDTGPTAHSGDAQIASRLGQGARYVSSVEGRGVEPGATGPAAIIDVPSQLWTSEGTLAFRLRTSRTLRYSAGEPRSSVILTCPVFTLTLTERLDHVRLHADLAHDGTMTDKQTLNRFALGKVAWSHLEAGTWYHLAISWSAKFPENRLELFLNGTRQEEMRPGRAWWYPWRLPKDADGPLKLGGVIGEGEHKASIAVDSVQLYPRLMDEADVRATLFGRPNFALTNEGRWDHEGALDLAPFELTPAYETEFDAPLSFVHEDALFDGETRAREPRGREWVLEGGGEAWTENGRCVVLNEGNHQVLWNTRPFPESFLLEFGMEPRDSRTGLAVVFFAAKSPDGGSIFTPGLPRRGGSFKNYTKGAINSYHCSYWATSQQDILRRTANLRKNAGFYMPAVGIDRIGGTGHGPHRVRILKVANRIEIETDGKRALVFTDDGETYGPAWRDGYIGLRQMAHARRVSYTHFKVWRVDRRDAGAGSLSANSHYAGRAE